MGNRIIKVDDFIHVVDLEMIMSILDKTTINGDRFQFIIEKIKTNNIDFFKSSIILEDSNTDEYELYNSKLDTFDNTIIKINKKLKYLTKLVEKLNLDMKDEYQFDLNEEYFKTDYKIQLSQSEFEKKILED